MCAGFETILTPQESSSFSTISPAPVAACRSILENTEPQIAPDDEVSSYNTQYACCVVFMSLAPLKV